MTARLVGALTRSNVTLRAQLRSLRASEAALRSFVSTQRMLNTAAIEESARLREQLLAARAGLDELIADLDRDG
jgi:cell division protein FtsB